MIPLKPVKHWIDTNLVPLAWERISLKLLPEFKKEGLMYFEVNENTQISTKLAQRIDDSAFELYNIRIPPDLLRHKDL